MLVALTRRDVENSGKKLAQRNGMEFRIAKSGERISATYRQSVQLVSGKYALGGALKGFHTDPLAAGHREGAESAGLRPRSRQRYLLGVWSQARAWYWYVG